MTVLAVFGTGGFGREIMPIAKGQHGADVLFIEDDPRGESCNGYRVMSTTDFLHMPADKLFAVSVADPLARRQVVERLTSRGARPHSISSALANFYPPHTIGEGAVICAYVSIHPNVRIGKHFHANIYSYVAHDCVIGDFVTFAPRVNCNGNVHIGDGAYIGTGAMFAQGASSENPLVVGAGAVVGMGSVVTKSVPPRAVVYGNPAKVQRYLEE